MNKYKSYLTIFVLFIICTLTIGYAAFGSEVSISNIVATVRAEKDIRITDVKIVSTNNGEINELNYDVDSILGNVNLLDANSTITLEVSVTNFGNTEMGVYDITGLSDSLSKVVSGYELQKMLCDDTGKCSLGAIAKFNITLGYNAYDGLTKNHDIRLDLDFRKMHTVTYDGITNNGYPSSVIDGGTLSFTATGTIPPKIVAFNSSGNRVDYDAYSYSNNVFNYNGVSSDITLKYSEKTILTTSTEGKHFKEADYVSKIKNVEFVDYIDEGGVSNALKSYDLSKNGDMSIIGWIDSNYKLWIGSDWTIYPEHLGQFFYGMSAVENIIFNNINTENNVAIYAMFSGCSSLKTIDLSMFNTTRVSYAHSMFDGCSSLASIKFREEGTDTKFITTLVTKLNAMFRNCNALQSLDLSSFNVENVTSFSEMFYECNALTELNLSNFNTSSAIYLNGMFRGCSSLKTLNISNFNTENVENMNSMFYDCSTLSKLDVSHFNTQNVTTMGYMFYNVKAIEELVVSNFNTSNVTNFDYMFYGLEKVTELNLDNFDTGNATNMKHMFENMINLKTLDLKHFKTSGVTEMASMFRNMTALETLDISGFDTSKVTRMDSMFREASAITELDLRHFDTSNVTNMSYMFNSCSALTEVLVSDLWVVGENTEQVNMYLFSGIENTGVTYA